MVQKKSGRGRSGLCLALGVALAAGCTQPPRGGSPLATAERTPRLSAAQAADVQVALARTLEKRGDEEGARATYAEALKQDPKRTEALVRLAVLCDRQARFKESEELYRRALAARPNDADLHCNRGYSLYLQQRWAEAEQSLRHAVSLRPDHLRAHNNLGLVLTRAGREAEALEEFRRGGCNEADAHSNVACALMLGDNWPAARQHYEFALAANPTSASAQKGLQALAALMHRHQPAQQELAAAPRSTSAPQVPEVVPVGYTVPATLARPQFATEDWAAQEILPPPAVETVVPAPRTAPRWPQSAP
jgi:Tfp pilus assembly protein PilF